jgi:hypothetical protein
MPTVEPQNVSPLAPQSGARRDLTLAWASVALMIVDLVAVMFAGEGAAEKGAAGWLIGLAVMLFLLLLGLAAMAVAFGLRARRKGTGAGLAPALVGGIGGGWFALTNLVGLVARLVFGME